MRNIRVYLDHIVECIVAIQQYTQAGRHTLNDSLIHDAVLRRLQVMAESTLRLPDDLKANYPAVGWQYIRNFRNILVHEYLRINTEIIWRIIEDDLPTLHAAVTAMRDSLPDEDEED